MHCKGSVRLMLGLLLLAGGCVANDRSVISSAESTHGSLQPAVIQDPQLSTYLQQVGERIIAAAKEADAEHDGPKSHFESGQSNAWMFSDQMKFHFVNSKTLNAFTTGGEHMYIYNELFQQCATEDELAAVMSHEYAHVYCRHVAKGQANQMRTLLIGAAVGGAAGYALGDKDNRATYAASGAGVGAAGGQFLNMGFTRADEEQADKFGFRFYTMAGWDPRHFADFFQYMIDKGYDTTPAMLSDHPTLKSRVEQAKKWVADLQKKRQLDKFMHPPIANPQQFAQLKARAATLSKSLPDDKSLQSSQQLLQALPRSCVMPADPPDAQQARQQLADKAAAHSSK